MSALKRAARAPIQLWDEVVKKHKGPRHNADHYEELHGRVRGILILAEPYLPPDWVRSYDEDIDHNEHGVALDSIVDAL